MARSGSQSLNISLGFWTILTSRISISICRARPGRSTFPCFDATVFPTSLPAIIIAMLTRMGPTRTCITTGPVGKPLGPDPSGIRVVMVRECTMESQYYGLGNIPNQVDLSSHGSLPNGR